MIVDALIPERSQKCDHLKIDRFERYSLGMNDSTTPDPSAGQTTYCLLIVSAATDMLYYFNFSDGFLMASDEHSPIKTKISEENQT